MCLRESTSPMTANFFLYACISANSSSVAILSSSGFLYVATRRKKKTTKAITYRMHAPGYKTYIINTLHDKDMSKF